MPLAIPVNTSRPHAHPHDRLGQLTHLPDHPQGVNVRPPPAFSLNSEAWRKPLRGLILVLSLAVVASSPAAAGGLVEAGELEAARANARAGGPTNERDAELLQRYGCTSGTNSPTCEPHRYYRHPQRHSHRRHRY